MIKSSGPPDKTTPGNVGDIYQNTDNGEIFVCKDVKHRSVRQQFIEVSAKDVNTEYVWESTKIEPKPAYPKVLDATRLFSDNKRLDIIDKFDYSECENMNHMFDKCTNLTTIPSIDTSKATNMSYMFGECVELTTIPRIDTSKATNVSYMFYMCGNLDEYPKLNYECLTNLSGLLYGAVAKNMDENLCLNTINATDMSNMFVAGNVYRKNIPYVITKNVTNMSGMFRGSYNNKDRLYKVISDKRFDTSKVTNMSSMFESAFSDSIAKLPKMDTSNVTNMSKMFYHPGQLTYGKILTIEGLDMRNVTNASNMFTNFEVQNLTLTNINVSLSITGNYKVTDIKLSTDSIIGLIKELITSDTPKQLTIGSSSISKIADLRCKVTDDSDPKKPMELCDSTEEGAITLTEYALLKNWTVQ